MTQCEILNSAGKGGYNPFHSDPTGVGFEEMLADDYFWIAIDEVAPDKSFLIFPRIPRWKQRKNAFSDFRAQGGTAEEFFTHLLNPPARVN